MAFRTLFSVFLFILVVLSPLHADTVILKKAADGKTAYDANWSYADFTIASGVQVKSIYGGFRRSGSVSAQDYIAQFNLNSTAFSNLSQNAIWNYDTINTSMYNKAIDVSGKSVIGPGTLRLSLPTGVGAIWDSAYIIISNTSPTPPIAPTLTSPSNGSINIKLPATLSWNSSSGATTYQLQISTDSVFSNIVLNNSNLTTTSQSIGSLSNSTNYFWRVSAINSAGTSSYSNGFKFTTVPPIPPTPTLVYPASSASNIPLSLSLSWNLSTGATTYRLQLASDSLFSNILTNDSMVTTASFAIGPLATGTTYFWRINAKNLSGTSGFSPVQKFATIPATPGIPVLISPPNASINISTTPALSWNTLPNATSYYVQVASDSNFQTLQIDYPNLNATSLVIVQPLPNSGVFYWHVKGNNSGTSSGWSATWKFTTVPPPPVAPLLLTPSQNSQNISPSTTFTWLGFLNSQYYNLQIATDSLFTQVFVSDSIQGTTSPTIGPLLKVFTFYWRVNAVGFGGVGPWSNTGVFTTSNVTPIFQKRNSKSAKKTSIFDLNGAINNNWLINGKRLLP